MEKRKRRVMVIILIVAVVILLATQIIRVLLQNQQVDSQEISQIANAEKEEMLADYVDVTGNENINPPSDKKKAIMEKLSQSWDPSKVETVEVQVSDSDQTRVKVPVPKGYKVSGVTGENTLNGGVVIYEGEEEVTGTSSEDSNVKTAQQTRNQWVWVPVYDSSDIYGTDANGKMWGKLYNYDDTGRTADNWSEQDAKMTISSKTSDREPDLLSSYDKDDYLSRYLSETDKEQLSKELKNTFEKTIESIEKYGGFYIGRYETGGLNGTAKVVKGDANISSQTWYTMYEKCKDLKGENRNVETSMIWGCEWDRTLQWLVDTENKEYTDVGKDSTEWGNYYNKQLTYTNETGTEITKNKNKRVRIPSGSSETTKANNIYDMAGNVLDWTLEACSTSSRRLRGGSYNDYGDNYPADYRDYYDPYYSGDYVRVQGSTLRRPVG